jgi:hypothetical protein
LRIKLSRCPPAHDRRLLLIIIATRTTAQTAKIRTGKATHGIPNISAVWFAGRGVCIVLPSAIEQTVNTAPTVASPNNPGPLNRKETAVIPLRTSRDREA